MTAVLSGIVVVAAAALMFVCLCVAMSREARDRACPVRPVPPRSRPRTDLDDDPIWATTPVEGGESPAEMWALRGLRARYPEAYLHLLAEATANTPTFSLDHLPQVAEATEGGTPPWMRTPSSNSANRSLRGRSGSSRS